MSKSLYTAAEIKQFKEQQVKKQKGIDPITKEPFAEPAVQDHDHSTQHCRAALNRNCNSFEGLVTNAYKRCLRWLTDVPLPELLRNLADYLEVDYSDNPYHNGWMKAVKVEFNKLNSKQMKQVLEHFGYADGKNLKERKEKFAKIVLDKRNSFDTIRAVLLKVKEGDASK